VLRSPAHRQQRQAGACRLIANPKFSLVWGVITFVYGTVNKRKMAKHFTLTIADGAFSYQPNSSQIEHEALFDGIYILRTDQPATRIAAATVVRAYKQLKVNEPRDSVQTSTF
jgi:hypothetical protein